MAGRFGTREIPHVEKPVCEWADKHGIRHRKINGGGNSGYPDRMFFIPGGRPFLIEFKAPGKPLEPLQVEVVSDLMSLGYDVLVTDDPKIGIQALRDRMLKACQK